MNDKIIIFIIVMMLSYIPAALIFCYQQQIQPVYDFVNELCL